MHPDTGVAQVTLEADPNALILGVLGNRFTDDRRRVKSHSIRVNVLDTDRFEYCDDFIDGIAGVGQ